jgi:SAM-dependent methyltransferase
MGCDDTGIIALYERHAHRWDRERSRRLVERAWLDRFLSLVTPGSTILDLGCGSGEPIARYLMDAGYDVAGVDASPAMIDMCKRRFPDAAWITADMRTLCLDRQFQGILAWDSFFHLCEDDQRRTFPVFAAHAGPGSGLMFTSGPRAGRAIGTYQGEALFHASLDPAEYQSLLNAHGFRVVAHAIEDPACGGHTVWLAQRM